RNEMDPLLCGSTSMSHNEFTIREPIEPQEASPMKHEMHVLGIDIAKRVFHAVGMDDRGTIVYRKRLSRHDLMPPTAHQRYAEWTPQRLIRWAADSGAATAQLVETILASRPHPQQGFRSCLGIMRLGKSSGAERLEAACRRALTIGACS